MMIGFQGGVIGLLADLIRGNRRLVEDKQYRAKKLQISLLPNNGIKVAKPRKKEA